MKNPTGPGPACGHSAGTSAPSRRRRFPGYRIGIVGTGNDLAAQNEEPEPSTDHTAIARFKRWYDAAGHWVYNGRADALQTWIERGISTLPDAPANALAVLADWVKDDPFAHVFAVPADKSERAATQRALDERRGQR